MTGRLLTFAFLTLTTVWAGHSAASVAPYASEPDRLATVDVYYNESFDLSGPLADAGLAFSNGAVGSARDLLIGSVWIDRAMDGASTAIRYGADALTAAGDTWDILPEW